MHSKVTKCKGLAARLSSHSEKYTIFRCESLLRGSTTQVAKTNPDETNAMTVTMTKRSFAWSHSFRVYELHTTPAINDRYSIEPKSHYTSTYKFAHG